MNLQKHASQLNLLCWDGYDHPGFTDSFTLRNGSRLNTTNLISDHLAAREIMQSNCKVDLININNPYPRHVLYPAGRIQKLDEEKLSEKYRFTPAWLSPFAQWARASNDDLIGICQRFGSFNFVVNNQIISNRTATDLGFTIVDETKDSLPYGILLFPEFNIFHICIACGLNPFVSLSQEQLDQFETMANVWFANASLITEDSHQLNKALVNKEIGYFLSGGSFTSANVRLQGHLEIESITPSSGPINGKGAIGFMEVTSLISTCRNIDAGYQYLNHMLEPDSIRQIATNPRVCNPVLQMFDSTLFAKMPLDYLRAIQFDTLESSIHKCALYEIPPDFDALSERLERARLACA